MGDSIRVRWSCADNRPSSVNLRGGAIVYSCSTTDWCCDIGLEKNGCCSDAANLLDLGPREVQTTVGVRSPAESSYGAAASGSMAPGSSSLSSITQTSTASLSTMTEHSPTSSGGAIATSSQPDAAPYSSNHLGAAIGAGVGVPLGVGLVAAFVYLWIRLKRQRKRLEEEGERREKTVQWERSVAEHHQAMASEPQEMDTRVQTQPYFKPELSEDARREIFEVAGHGEQHS